MKRLAITFIAVVAMVVGVFAFVDHRPTMQTSAANQRLAVVATNSILADMVEAVGGKDIEVYSIVDRGIDPHEYEPKPTDMTKTAEADLVFHNGLNLETGGSGWFKKLVQTAGKTFNEDVFAASEGVTPRYLTTNVDEVDPHAWLDLENGIQYVHTISAKLQAADPARAKTYAANEQAYVERLQALHDEAKAKFAGLPQAQRVLVTSEGAFKYFGAAYGVDPVYIWEINTESQGTPEQMKTVLAKIRQATVKGLFVESSVSPKSMQKVAKETGIPVKTTLFTDSLAREGKAGDTYYGMMAWNLDKIYQGLAE